MKVASSSDKVALEFTEIAARLKAADLPPVEVVYGIAIGGIVPAALAAFRLDVPLVRLDINYRAADNTPQRPEPELLTPAQLPKPDTDVLLVDDVSVSGKTLDLAKSLLIESRVTTMTLKGKADVVLFPEVSSCVVWPWTAK